MGSPSSRKRPLGGYGPLLGLALAFVLAVSLVPTVPQTREGPAVARAPAATEWTEVIEEEVLGEVATPSGGEGESRTPEGPRARPPVPGGTRRFALPAGPRRGRSDASAGAGGVVESCQGQSIQVPGDPYSPSCVVFSGDNGGATSRGVTGERILVSARMVAYPNIQRPSVGTETFIPDEDVRRTLSGLVDYFNSRFQFYGRRMEIAFFEGRGSFLKETQGGGQEEAESDAIRVSEELGAFAELNAYTAPFAAGLARRGVLNFGAPSMSREWLTERRPFSWSAMTDCSVIVEMVADYLSKRVAGRPAAHAGGTLRGAPRRIGLIAPDSPWYQECVRAGDRIFEARGHPLDAHVSYRLDFTALSNQAASVIAKLKSKGITTVVCGCDPVFPVFLTTKAAEQEYEPEWIVPGAGFTDVDTYGQLYDQGQWSRAFGISFAGAPLPERGGFGYHAYKAVRDDEPAALVEFLYANLYVLALGVHQAGPRLTPESFERGLFAYPIHSGPLGTWGFGPSRYTPTQDAREIYWDPARTSPLNGKPGTYIETGPGRRYRPGEWTSEDPAVFTSRPSP